MRCREGDLAYVVHSRVLTPGLAGRFVVVEKQVFGHVVIGTDLYEDCTESWICRAADGGDLPIASVVGRAQGFVKKRVIDDVLLRPIRDPGDSATDETLLRLPAPSSTKEPA